MSGPDSPPPADQPGLERLERRIESLQESIDRLRELVVRAYEDTPKAAEALFQIRRAASYRDAYSSNPLITVRVGTYQGGDLLFDRALRSVQQQSYPHWEAVVVCDGQDSQTAERVAALGDPRFTCFQRPRNGPYPSDKHARWQVAGAHPFNEAVARARGAWIAPIDDDDEWSPDHLELLLGAALHTQAEVVYGIARVVVAEDGETYFGTWPPEEGDFGFQAAIYHAGLAAFLYDANSYLVGEVADWHLARRMLEAGVRFDLVQKIVTTYYINGDAAGLQWWRDRLRHRGRFVEAAPGRQSGD